jgi:hypothetical protein
VTSLRLSSAHLNAHARDSTSPPMPHPAAKKKREKRYFRVPRRCFRETREREGRGFRGPSERAARRGRGGAPSSLLPTHRSRTARIRGRSCPSGTS